ncbi:hypothetical protein N7478_009379 [Penicillium angulare]|uniref:uncharacterized protein n=1 Tax=Penicillium angulare TaxID=116970 RepID=UPI002540C30E|nr:uncharacterized protein N7478_009379 [Penicillium angulare]KAJ5266571.1 hypothetical protein N7478_009379 [Penicillium angulare]
MNLLKRLQSLFKYHHAEHTLSAGPESQTETPASHPNGNDDPYRNLSEITAPEPVERLTDDECTRKGSLETELLTASRARGQADEDEYRALSEVAAPEPCSISRSGNVK